MYQPFLGQVSIFSFGYAPKYWTLCNGQLLPINQNQALFSLLGTTYGGNGTVTFALPDLRGRVLMHRGNGFTQGQTGGLETYPLLPANMPAHTHTNGSSITLKAVSETANAIAPAGNYLAASRSASSAAYITSVDAPNTLVATNSGEITGGTVSSAGGLNRMPIMQPFLAINYSIALSGIFPSRN